MNFNRNLKGILKWTFKGKKIKETKEAVSLGHQLAIGTKTKNMKANERLGKAKGTFARIKRMHAPGDAKRRMVRAKAIPQAVYGSAVNITPKTEANRLGKSVTQTMWGDTFGTRAHELVQAVALDPTTDHPLWASIAGGINDLSRCIRKRPEIGKKLKDIKGKRDQASEEMKRKFNGPISNLEK